ncbi:hypothetical protein F511_06122 [Dorcoceras hygrometricum]|uniref:Uncharacterized protein n=1 Tax=Dorcoceras hygrometricum TaxID=472368 RepID=A0A2Z7BL58_9LAMI|nr:hypothetical protein F511_06122 [Dorcoceras hygrometricum]
MVLFTEPFSGRLPSIYGVVWIKTGGAELVLLSSLDCETLDRYCSPNPSLVDCRRFPSLFGARLEALNSSCLALSIDRCVVPERSSAIIGVVTDRIFVSEYHRAVMVNWVARPEYHGPMISTG